MNGITLPQFVNTLENGTKEIYIKINDFYVVYFVLCQSSWPTSVPEVLHIDNISNPKIKEGLKI